MADRQAEAEQSHSGERLIAGRECGPVVQHPCANATEVPAPATRLSLRATGYALERRETVSSQIAQSIHRGLLCPQAWMLDPHEPRLVCGDAKTGTRLVLQHREHPPASVYQDAALLEQWLTPLRAIVSRLGDLHADIQLALEMHWLEHRQADGCAAISPADLMLYRGRRLRGRRNLFARRFELQTYSDILRDVLRPELEGPSGTLHRLDPRTRKWETVALQFEGPLWHADLWTAPDLFREQSLIVQVRYRPNDWLTSALEPYRPQLMRIAPVILQFDPYRQQFHKRLGYFLCYWFRVNPGGPRAISVAALLAGAAVQLHAPTDGRLSPDYARNPGRFIGRVERALKDLHKAKVVGDYDPPESYPLPKRDPLSAWLAWKRHFTPPADVQAQYATIARHRHRPGGDSTHTPRSAGSGPLSGEKRSAIS